MIDNKRLSGFVFQCIARIYDINEDDIVNEINKKADKYGFCRVKGVNKNELSKVIDNDYL